MHDADQAELFSETQKTPDPRLYSGQHICLIDYGNYHFLFDLVRNWPPRLGRMSYLFGTAQLGRNTEVADVNELASGGLVRGLGIKPTAPGDHFFARQRNDIQTARATVKQLDTLNPDVVIGANNPLDVQAQIAKWCRERQRPFLFWLQDLRGMAMRSILQKRIPIFGRLVGKYYTILENRLLRQSSHVISITDEFCPYVLSTGISESQISVIHNWAPINRIPLRPKDNDWSRSVGLSTQRVVLYTGNLGMKHNPPYLLALCEALKDEADVTVAVVAEGTGANWLAKQAKESRVTNLFMHPFVSAALLPDVLGAADVCVALLEPDAGAYSVPSKIWTYLCGAKPLVLSIPRDNQAALIVGKIGAGISSNPGDEAQFVTNCLAMLSKNSEERAEIGRRGRLFAESNFEMDSIVQRVSRCIDLARRPHRDTEFAYFDSREQRPDRLRSGGIF